MKTRFAGLLCGAGFFVAVGAAPALAETHRLPLKFETGKTYTFQVTQNHQGPSIGSETPTQTDTGTDTGASERPGSSPEGRSQGAPRQGAVRDRSDKSIEYRIQVQNQTGNETTLEVTATPDAVSPGTGTSPSSSSSRGSVTEGSSTQGSSSRSDTGSGSSAAAHGLRGGTWIVRVDGNGRVTNVSKRDASGSTGTPSSSSSTGGAGQAGAAEGSRGTDDPSRAGSSARAGENVLRRMGAEGLLRSHLAFICGANLHEEELQPGKIYSPFGGESSLQGSPETRSQESESPPSRSGQDRPGSSPGAPGGSSASSSSDETSPVWLGGVQLEMLRFRFDGSSNQGGRELAKFSVLESRGQESPGSSGSSRQGGTTGQSGQAGQGGEPGEARRSQSGGTPAVGAGEGAPTGQALFRKDDGILEQLTARIGGSAAPGTQGSSSQRSGSGTQGIQSSSDTQAGGFLLSIRRTTSGGGTGSDTGTGTRQRQ
jgi:hypothetical protein